MDPFFRARYYENSHFNFTTCYMWRDLFDFQWAIEDDVLFMTTRWKGQPMVLQPFGPEEKMTAAAEKQAAWMKAQGMPFFAYNVEKSMAQIYEALPGEGLFGRALREEADYLYKTEDLIRLAGRRYHTKKNHLNSFRRNYPEAQYVPITPEIVPECKLNLNAWYKVLAQETPDDPYLATERAAIIEILNDFPDFGLKGGAIALGRRIVAFTFGEPLNRDTVVIHVEKSAPDVGGAYAAINQAFLEHEWADMTYVNRQEDMGLDGLRKAKESYRPVKMIEKYTVRPQAVWEAET